MNIEVSELTIYPVKSMKGITLDSAQLTAKGLMNDRRWMVVRSNGQFVTQRDLPRLALIDTCLDRKGVILSIPGHGRFTVPFDTIGGKPVTTRVWGDECETVDQGEPVSKWLTQALGGSTTLKLVQMAPDFVRPQGKAELLGINTATLFADAAPFLVANETSLEALNRHLVERGQQEVPMNRFRPNITVRGLQAFQEHSMNGLRSNSYGLKFAHPCERCVVTTIDQDTAEKDPGREPFKTLRDINPAPGPKPAPTFGQNAILESGEYATISRGDRLEFIP